MGNLGLAEVLFLIDFSLKYSSIINRKYIENI